MVSSIRALLTFTILFATSHWTATAGPIWPVPIQPAVIGNFPSLEPGGGSAKHSAEDIAAPKDTDVKAVVAHTIVAVTPKQVIASNGTDLFLYGHLAKTAPDVPTDRPGFFSPADVGRAIAEGETFAVVLGADRRGGGSFDHIHFEYVPGFGTDAHIKNADGTFKTFNDLFDLTRDPRANPLAGFFTTKDPKASIGDDKPEIGPIFWRPRSDQVAGFKEFGNQQDKPEVRKGTFINGFVTVAQQITDDQGGCLPSCDQTTNDGIDATIKINNIKVSDPFQVSYQVKGTGVVAGKDIPERVLVTFDQTHQVQESENKVVHDRRRDVAPGTTPDGKGLYPRANHFYNLTSTDGDGPDVANSWYTRAKAGQGESDGTGAAAATNNAEGKFPDGIYQVDGFGFDIGADGTPANKTSIPYMTRVNNWEQTAVPTKGDGDSDVQRARDHFKKEGNEVKPSPLKRSFHVDPLRGTGDDIFGVGDNYLAGMSYEWSIFEHRDLWADGDPLMNFLLSGMTRPADARGFIDDTFLVNALSLYGRHGDGLYDLVFDYDMNRAFSWTLDGVSAFRISAVSTAPEPSLLALMMGAMVAAVATRRNRRWHHR